MKVREKSSKLRFHKQEKVYSCAVACLKMILEYFGRNVEESELTKANIFPIVYVNTYFLNGIFVTHAVIVEDVTEDEVLIIDPAEGRKMFTLEIFKRIWDFCNNLAITLK